MILRLGLAGLQADVNLLVGRNGAGKSTVLQLICFGLQFLAGKRTEDVLAHTLQEDDAEIHLTFALEGGVETHARINVGDAHTNQGNTRRQHPIRVLQFVENRQPKNTMGVGRSQLRDHSMDRYANAISELKLLLASKAAADRRLVEETLRLCRRLPVGDDDAWRWIESAIPERGKNRARPLSCGQFDVLALCLDLVRSIRSDQASLARSSSSSTTLRLISTQRAKFRLCNSFKKRFQPRR